MNTSAVQTEVVTRGRRNPLHFGLPKRLRAAREAADLGVAQLALAAGLSSSSATFIEGGTVPLLDTIEQIAQVLKISPCWLAYGIQADFVAPGDKLQCAAVGERLQQVRQARGVSRKALGTASGTSDTTVRQIEEGRVPSVATAEKLAKALKVDPCWLSFGQGTAPNT